MKNAARFALALILAACGNDDSIHGGIEVTGWLDPSLIDATAADPLTADTPATLTVAGRPGAAPGRGRITVTNRRSAEAVSVDVTSAGSFVAQLSVLLNDGIAVQYADGEAADNLELQAALAATFPAATAPPTIHAPDVHGNVVISVTFDQDLGDTQIFVANHHNNDVAELTQVATNAVAGHILAHTGDSLLLYAHTAAGTSEAHNLVVP